MRNSRVLFICLALVLVVIISCANANSPISNPSFEIGSSGLAGWNVYPYSVSGYWDDDALPVAGTFPDTFDVLPALSAPDGMNVCGLQSLGDEASPAEPCRNGGVFQSFIWTGGEAEIVVSGRAYSEDVLFPEGWGASDNGCKVSVGLANLITSSYLDAYWWDYIPWGDYETWATVSLEVPGPGNYTIFIQSYQPSNSGWTTTVWDNVQFIPHPAITEGPTVETAVDSSHPDTIVRVSWTTDVATYTRVHYGPTSQYGETAFDDTLTINHSILLENLTPSGHYHFKVESGGGSCVTVFSEDATFDVPVQFSNITATVDGSDMIITWDTDIPTTSRVEYGYTTSYGSSSVEDATLATNHEVVLSELDEVQLYHYCVWATAPNCTSVASSDQTFTTLPLPRSTLENSSFEDGSLFPWVQYKSSTPSGCGEIDGLLGPYPAAGSETWSSALIKAYDGSYFVGAAASLAYKDGGVYQRLYWPPGEVCYLCARFATQSLGGGYYDTRVRLGIDPNGGIDPASEDIVWWTGFSCTNDNQWYPGGVSAVAGADGMVTAFLDIEQRYPISTHIVAVDDVTFGASVLKDVGALKQEESCTGVEINNVIVTCDPQSVSYEAVYYNKAYVQRVGSPSGIAVLFDQAYTPLVGDRLNLAGTLMMLGKEAVIMADTLNVLERWREPPEPVGMSQTSVGGSAHNQPALYGSTSLCNVGSRVRIWGVVTDAAYDYDFSATVAYIDDGTGLLEHAGAATGTKVVLKGSSGGVSEGDYLYATGVLSILQVDPDANPATRNEYYTYIVLTHSSEDWTLIPSQP